jgi:membrane protein YqaA with SNARE-associated domain
MQFKQPDAYSHHVSKARTSFGLFYVMFFKKCLFFTRAEPYVVAMCAVLKASIVIEKSQRPVL